MRSLFSFGVIHTDLVAAYDKPLSKLLEVATYDSIEIGMGGKSTMSSAFPLAMNYHRYIYAAVKPYLGSRVWEIGCGHGQYTRMLIADGAAVLASDIEREYLEKLKPLATEFPKQLQVSFVDLTKSETIRGCAEFAPDSIVCLNVLEHIEDDVATVRNLYNFTSAHIRAVFLTPALPLLFGFMDEEAGHFRRYTRRSLEKVFCDAGWSIERSFYQNPIGAVGWFVKNRVLPSHKKDLDSPDVNRDIQFFDKYCVYPTRMLDMVTSKFFGQSVVVVATKR